MRAAEPSLTAVGVALARSTLVRPATPTGDPASDESLTASLLSDGSGRRDGLIELTADGQVAGFLGFITARTEFFDWAVLDAVNAGFGQVVILGAGYDGRALRFRAPGTRFFEVDHPATQADKRSRLDQLGVATDGITFVTADFTEPGLGDALESAGHRRDERSLFVLEGVLRYLPEPWFREVLAVIAAHAGPGSQLAASISTRVPGEPPDQAEARRRHEQALAESGEPVLTVPDREVALRWLAEAGWIVDSVVDVADLQPSTSPGWLLVLAHP